MMAMAFLGANYSLLRNLKCRTSVKEVFENI